MRTISKYPSLSKRVVVCKHCNSILAVEDEDVMGVEFDNHAEKESTTKNHLFSADECIEKIISGYWYTLKCNVCNVKFSVLDNTSIRTERYYWAI